MLNSQLSVHNIISSNVEWGHRSLSLTRQTELLGVSRSSLYYQPATISEEDLILQTKVDEIYTAHPESGARTIKSLINREREQQELPTIGRKRIRSIMRKLGLEAVYPKPRLSDNPTPHLKYPYLLRGLKITYPNQVWSTDITYIRMHKGFVYLTAILDWYSRYVIAWRISTSLDRQFCLDAGEEALQIAVPYIMNSDQGVQFTSQDYLDLYEKAGAIISMDGRGRALDNNFVERLWRTIKYGEVYLKSYQSVMEAVVGIGSYIRYYNEVRPHQSLQERTPAQVYYQTH